MLVRLVYDGGDDVFVPPEMGTPRHDQLQGTPLEKLSELAGRISYDSLGQGRSSADFHRHILEVGHLSVYRHAVDTAWIGCDRDFAQRLLLCCLNRRGVHGRWNAKEGRIEITANLQALIEWNRYHPELPLLFDRIVMDRYMVHMKHLMAPSVMPNDDYPDGVEDHSDPSDYTDDQAHVSLFMQGSRGFSHEMVRHNYAVSQRSTRYCDESETPWEEHPLVAAFLAEPQDNPYLKVVRERIRNHIEVATGEGQTAYNEITRELELWLTGHGVGKLTARKQARGAARGYLGHALQTELIFTAPVSGWKDILRQRLNPAADAEFRAVMSLALGELRRSRYGSRFNDIKTKPSPDGLGEVIES